MCCDEVFPFRAAFQYGIKMSEGRKTRRFKETNEKAELDRQWKKISAVSSITRIETGSKLEPDRYWMFGANTVINIRKKKHSDTHQLADNFLQSIVIFFVLLSFCLHQDGLLSCYDCFRSLRRGRRWRLMGKFFLFLSPPEDSDSVPILGPHL